MKDKDFLHWLADRLTMRYREDSNVDFVLKLRSIAEALDPKQDTPNNYHGDR